MASNTDPVGAQQVQDHLRYRLQRLVTSSSWDNRNDLKLRVLKLIFSFMVRENERILEESRDVPSLRLGRSLSIGRTRAGRDLAPRRVSKWSETLNEIGRMPGNRLLPLMKLMLLENMQQSGQQGVGGAGHGIPLTPPTTPGQISSAPPQTGSLEVQAAAQAVNASLLNDLLGLNEGARGQQPSGSHRSSSPAPSSVAPGDDPFVSLAEGRSEASYGPQQQHLQQQYSREGVAPQMQRLSLDRGGSGSGHLRASSPTVSHSSSSVMTAPPGVQTPPTGYGMHPATAISTGAVGHFGAPTTQMGGSYNNGSGTASGPYRQASGSYNGGGSLPPSSPGHLQRMGSGGVGYPTYSTPPNTYNNMGWGVDVSKMTPPQAHSYDPNFDAASPYLVRN